MLGNSRRSPTPPQLVTPEEAVELALKFGTAKAAYIAKDIADEYKRRTAGEKDGIFRQLFMYAAIFEAGRLQGVREERYRRKPRAATL